MIYNITKKKILSRKPKYYLKGNIVFPILINESFKHYDSIVLQNRKTFFTWFLKLKMDVILADNDNKILDFLKSSSYRKFYLSRKELSTIIFLPTGSIDKFHLEIKDQLNLNAELTTDFKKKLKKHLQGAIAPSSTFMSNEK